jgi:polyphenol oxidase
MVVPVPAHVEPVADFDVTGVLAFTTTRARGDFNVAGDAPVSAVLRRWHDLQREVAVPRFVHARQVHGRRVVRHGDGWSGWLRIDDADGHMACDAGIALAVTLADCVPVFLAHPDGAIGLLHAGWRGTAAGIVAEAARQWHEAGLDLREIRAHLGPAICGDCYEVGPDVIRAVLGKPAENPRPIDLRTALREQLEACGVRRISTSPRCTRCHNEQFFSHRMGDAGRHIAVLARLA